MREIAQLVPSVETLADLALDAGIAVGVAVAATGALIILAILALVAGT